MAWQVADINLIVPNGHCECNVELEASEASCVIAHPLRTKQAGQVRMEVKLALECPPTNCLQLTGDSLWRVLRGQRHRLLQDLQHQMLRRIRQLEAGVARQCLGIGGDLLPRHHRAWVFQASRQRNQED